MNLKNPMRIQKIEIFREARTFIDGSYNYYSNLFQTTPLLSCDIFSQHGMILHSLKSPIDQLQLNWGQKGPIVSILWNENFSMYEQWVLCFYKCYWCNFTGTSFLWRHWRQNCSKHLYSLWEPNKKTGHKKSIMQGGLCSKRTKRNTILNSI